MIRITNTQHWILEQVKKNPDKIFVKTTKENFSFSESLEKAKNVYNYCVKRKIKPNSRVAVLVKHNADFIFTVLGLWLNGAVPVLIDKNQTAPEIDEQKKIAETDISIIPGEINFNSVHNKKNIEYEFNSENFSLILFTSGSTGKIKAVVHTYTSLYQSCINSDKFINHSKDDIWLASLPFFHIGGFSIFFRTLICGCKIAIPDSLNTLGIINSVKQHSPTLASFVSTTFERMVQKKKSPWPNLRILFLGGGPLNQNKINNFVSKNWPIAKVYGSSETCAMVTAVMASEISKNKNFCGNALGDTIIQIDKENNILVYTKALFKGYFINGTLNNTSFKNKFYCTGDLGKITNNNLEIFSRRTDLIITGGKNVYPAEVENIIKKNYKVKDVKVLSLDDDEWGQIVTVVIIPLNGQLIDYNEFKIKLKKYLSGYKIPKKMLLLQNFPQTPTGKINIQKLKKMILASG